MTIFAFDPPVDLVLTLGPLQQGRRDPTLTFAEGRAWLAMRTPQGTATLSLARTARGISARAWGSGAEWAVEQAAGLAGAKDAPGGFAPAGKLGDLARKFAGMRLSRVPRLFDVVTGTVLGQRVSGKEAWRSFESLVKRWGEAAPGPKSGPSLWVPPAPEVLARLPYWKLHEIGVEKSRADTLVRIAKRAEKLEEALSMDAKAARARLEAFDGIGPWTSGVVALVAMGDADAVPLGDYHLPSIVAYAMTGRPRGTDEEMLELLAPHAPHRGRVVRLLWAAGIEAPRFGPRRPIKRY